MIRFKDLPHDEQVKYDDFNDVKAKFFDAELMANGLSRPQFPKLLGRGEELVEEDRGKPTRFYQLTVTNGSGHSYTLPVFLDQLVELPLGRTFALPYSWSDLDENTPVECTLSLTPRDVYPPKTPETIAREAQQAEIAKTNKALMKTFTDEVNAANRVLASLQEDWIAAMIRLNEDIQIRSAYADYTEMNVSHDAAVKILEGRFTPAMIKRALEGM